MEVEQLEVRYGSLRAVAGISFVAHRGEVLALLGPNGAGKTSTVETLEGYRRPSGGKASVAGLDPIRDHRALRGRIGVMLQGGGLYPSISARQALGLFSRYYADPEDPGFLIERLGLKKVARTPWRRLSGGERQRLSLALALVGKPEVAFLDEPTAGVDPEGRVTIREVIAELRERGTCVVMATHELPEAERLADQVAVLAGGRLVAFGSPAELSRATGPSVRFKVVPAGHQAGAGPDPGDAASSRIDTAGLALALGLDEKGVKEIGGGEYMVQARPSASLLAALSGWMQASGLEPADIRAGSTGLEEAYLSLVGALVGAPPEAPGDPGAEPDTDTMADPDTGPHPGPEAHARPHPGPDTEPDTDRPGDHP